MRHPNRYSYMDEVLEGFMTSMDTWDDEVFITQTLKDIGYNFKDYISPVCASIWRVITEDLVKFDELWLKYSLIGPNRDQLAFDAARQLTGMKMNILENGFLADERDENGDRLIGTMGISFKKVGRKKLHPLVGHNKQYMERDKLLAELKKITGLHPFFYAKYDHMPMVHRHVIRPQLPKS